jgi:hypothetical protein
LGAAEKDSGDLATQHGKDKTGIVLAESMWKWLKSWKLLEGKMQVEEIKLKLQVDS